MNLQQILAAASVGNDTEDFTVEYQGNKFKIFILNRVPASLSSEIKSLQGLQTSPVSAIASALVRFSPNEDGRNRMTIEEFDNLDRSLADQIAELLVKKHPTLFGRNEDGSLPTKEQLEEKKKAPAKKVKQ